MKSGSPRDGRRIAVGDMDEDHVRNALRMLIRKRRERQERDELEGQAIETSSDIEGLAYGETVGDAQDRLNAQAYRDLANPKVFFPLLDGGVYGSPELQRRYGGR